MKYWGSSLTFWLNTNGRQEWRPAQIAGRLVDCADTLTPVPAPCSRKWDLKLRYNLRITVIYQISLSLGSQAYQRKGSCLVDEADDSAPTAPTRFRQGQSEAARQRWLFSGGFSRLLGPPPDPFEASDGLASSSQGYRRGRPKRAPRPHQDDVI